MARSTNGQFNFSFVLLLMLFCSCENQQSSPQASLIFGEAYGFCAGDCAHFFQINGDKLYQDNIERYTNDAITFDPDPLTPDQYALANNLLANFPNYLLGHPNETFGCPDCTDQGGIHLYLTAEATEYFWHIDTFVDNQPVEIRQYINQVREVTNQLKN